MKYTEEEVQQFLDEELAQFRECVKNADSPTLKEIYLRLCDATSYLKQAFKVWKNPKHEKTQPT